MSKNFRIATADYGSHEVRIIASYFKDPALIQDILSGHDLHGDYAKIMELDKQRPWKQARYDGKNAFVFPEFYGSWYESVARDLRSRGYDISDETVKKAEQFFWRKYNVTKENQKKLIEFYQDNGYIEMFWGHRRRGVISKNQIANTAIQGCLQGNSKIQTENGWIPIKNLVGTKVNVWTGFTWAEAFAIHMGNYTFAKITLNSGIEINCDTRHKIKNEKNEWIDFQQLKIGDWVALPKVDISKRVHPQEEITWPFILGFILGDGSFMSRQEDGKPLQHILAICGGEKKKPILENIMEFLLKEGFKVHINITPPTENRVENRYRLLIYQKKMYEKLSAFGIVPDLVAKTKRIPSSVWGMNQQDQMNFLNGVFLSDGSRLDCSLHTPNRELLLEIQTLAYGLQYDSFIINTPQGFKLHFRQVVTNRGKFFGRSNRLFPFKSIEKALNGKRLKSYPRGDCIAIANACAIRSKKDFSQTTAERILIEHCPDSEVYRYDKIKNIEILKESGNTFTMNVNDPLHQFVADGVITKNSAFHCLLWALNRVNKLRRAEGWKSYIPAQIHDELFCYVHESELKYFVKTVTRIMQEDIRKENPFILVPLIAEWSFCEPGEPWYNKKTVDPDKLDEWLEAL